MTATTSSWVRHLESADHWAPPAPPLKTGWADGRRAASLVFEASGRCAKVARPGGRCRFAGHSKCQDERAELVAAHGGRIVIAAMDAVRLAGSSNAYIASNALLRAGSSSREAAHLRHSAFVGSAVGPPEGVSRRFSASVDP